MSRHRHASAYDPPPETTPRDSALGRELWKLLPYVRPYRTRLTLGLVTNGLARFFDLLPLLLVGHVVDAITAGKAQGGPPDASVFLLYGLLALSTFLGLALFQAISDYCLNSMAQLVRHDLRMALYEKLQSLELAFFDSRQTGEIMAVVSADVDNLEDFFADGLTSMVRILITFAGTFGFLIWMDARLALLLFIPLPVALLVIRFFATRIQPRYRAARQAVGEINALLENNLQGMGVIQAYAAEAAQRGRIEAASRSYRDESVAASKERNRFIPLIYLVAGMGYALLLAGGGYLALLPGGPSLGDFASFVLFAMRLILPLFVLGMIINQLQRSEASAARIRELLGREPLIKDAPEATDLDGPPQTIAFDHVSFAYPEREQTLTDVSFSVSRGQVLGICGPTGAGKSTMVKLLLRYHDPDIGHGGGAVLVNGTPLSRLTLVSYRKHLGYVSQDAFLFHGTVAENIRLGSETATDAEVAKAARVAGALEFIERLPQRFETIVGERGLKLSGGQRQRISLARAILRDPALLILDEATSAVDTATEAVIQENLHRFRKERITIAVAHRLSTIRRADRVLVVMDGRVAEAGSHEELLARKGVYAGLWAVQSGEPGEEETADSAPWMDKAAASR